MTNYELVVVHKNYEPGGDVIEVGRESFSATESEICTEICVSCLSSVKLTEIEYDIYHTLCSKNSIEFESFDEMILEDGKVIKRLLHKLESYGVIFSSPGESSQQVWSRSQVWELTEDTRRWASAIASTR